MHDPFLHPLKSLFAEKISEGLTRAGVKSCSKWAETYRIMDNGPWVEGAFPWERKEHKQISNWSFELFPWLKEMHNCKAEIMCSQKCAQMGMTEAALNKTFKAIDIDRKSVLYLLPTSGSAHKFSASRFDPCLSLSPHLKNLFSDVKNKAHKQAGTAAIFFRGTQVRDGLKSDPVDLIIFDELDEMPADMVSLAFARTLGKAAGTYQNFLLSTPSISGKGINKYFSESDQRHFMFKCPHCGKMTELVYPECLVVTAEDFTDPLIKNSHLICKECKKKLEHLDKRNFLRDAIWVPTVPGRLSAGYAINQLYSCRSHPSRIAEQVLKAIYSQSDEQEFYNSYLGLPREVEGARLTNAQIDACVRNYKQVQASKPGSFVTMGVDVGNILHYVVLEWAFNGNVTTKDINMMSSATLLKEGKTRNFEDLSELMHRYQVRFCVIDSQPEVRKATEFAKSFPGRVKTCTYASGSTGTEIKVGKTDPWRVNVDRTSFIDMMYGRFRTDRIILPQDLSQEYRQHLTSLVRVYKTDSSGNAVGRYEKPDNGQDHFCHSQTYAEIALSLGISLSRSAPLEGVF
jgi:hypothetical protein